MANPLSIPLNSGLILKKLTSIKERLLKKIDKKKPLKIAVLGGSSTDHIVEVLKVFLLNEKITSEFYQSNYNRFYEESVFKNENLKNFNPDIIYIHTSSLNLTNNISIKLKKKDIDQLLKQEFSKYQKIWNSLRKYKCLIIQNNFEFFPHRALGNLDCYHHAGHTRFVCKLNEMFYKEANINKNLIINDINYLSSYIGLLMIYSF
jgi:predicted enzyme involved in methoxymalonyl-ACP biosynthesis